MAILHRLQVQESRDDGATYEFLARDRAWSGYAICDLEPGPRRRSHYWVARDNGEITAICLFYQIGEACSLHTFGDPAGIAAILEQVPGRPAQAWVLAREDHLAAIRSRYEIDSSERMWRMIATRDTFSPLPTRARRLGMRNAPAVVDLYSATRAAAVRPETLLAQGCYGVWQDGRLVSIAGTHGLSGPRGIAAIGNIFTHPTYRNRGYAKMCVSALVADLMRVVPDIILNVSESNTPALRLYERLGFRRHCTYREGRAELLPEYACGQESTAQQRPGRKPAAAVNHRGR